MAKEKTSIWFKLGIGAVIAAAGALTLLYALRLAYANRVFPGVYGDGIYLGGLTKKEAIKLLDGQVAAYQSTAVTVAVGSNSRNYYANDLIGRNDSAKLVDDLYSLGRIGNPFTQIFDQLGLLVFGSDKTVSSVSLSPQAATALSSLANETAQPVSNASFMLNGGELAVNPAQPGKRLGLGLAALQLQSQLGQLKKDIVLDTTTLQPQLSSSQLGDESKLVEPYLQKPLVLSAAGKSFSIDANTLIGWLNVSSPIKPYSSSLLNNFYNRQLGQAGVGFDKNQIAGFVGSIAAQVNQEPQDAQLTIEGGKASVFVQSRDGRKLDVAASTDAVLEALKTGQSQPVQLAVSVQKAAVSSDTIDQLGIKELISEGVSYFPGSSANRMQNIRVGAARFNGILLKPGQVFSFGEYLGEVGPETGYLPSLVILGNREEFQYGGGLCQVSSTAYRAALLAGLPIVQRVSHAFAISYYTEPYGVPGVDATVYYPQVDMKFRNDTGSYILIQTTMTGTTLKFSFYGTKTKTGAIRGPFFVSGNSDTTKPSQTVFYRDVLDLAGKVIKTDTVNTSYKSSLDFPVAN
ncbi:VanW family protein [Candidatus Saccharibacteria bacterium]|nr:VanW family protein [Candidatus Saccharibacteria bacterium]